MSLPSQRRRTLLAQPHFRSITLWFRGPGVEPGTPGQRVAVVKDSAQEGYARAQGWQTVAMQMNGDVAAPLVAGVALPAIMPMSTGMHSVKDREIRRNRIHERINTQFLPFRVQ